MPKFKDLTSSIISSEKKNYVHVQIQYFRQNDKNSSYFCLRSRKLGKYSEEVKTKQQSAFLKPVHHAKSHMRLFGFDISRHSNAQLFALAHYIACAVFYFLVTFVIETGDFYAYKLPTFPKWLI